VKLTQGSGSSIILPADSIITNSEGKAVFIVSSTKAEKVTYIAIDITDGNLEITQKAEISFTAGAVNAGQSTVEADKTTVTANGMDSASITVTLKDAYGNPISVITVILSQDTGNSTIEAVHSTSRSDGTAVFTVKNTTAEQVTYTAKANGINVNQTVTVSFLPGPAEIFIVEAEGTQKAGTPFSVSVTAKDKYGNTATGYTGTVQLTSSDPKAVLPESYTFTAADQGTHIFGGVILKTAGEQSVTATDVNNGLIFGVSGKITVSTDVFDTGKSEIMADKTVVTADGVDSATITVTLSDAYSNPVKDKTVTLDQDSGTSVI